VVDSVDEMRELQEHAAAQAALFRIGEDEAEESTEDEGEDNEE